MNLIEQIEQNQAKQLSIHIGIDNMIIKNDLKQRVVDAVMNGEDFALINDSGAYAYFLI